MNKPENSITFDRAAAFYDNTRGFPPKIDLQAAALMARLGGVTRQSTVVEIGVGTGRIGLPLAQHTGPYIGIDLAAVMLQVLREKQPDYPDSDIRSICGDVMCLPLQSGCADYAVLVHILHLIPDPLAAASELARILKPGGMAITGWNRQQEPTLRALNTAWEAATGHAMRFDEMDAGPQTLSDAGWSLHAHNTLTYTTVTTAQAKAETYRQRVYSSMWRLPDATWRAGVEAVEKALAENFPDPHAPQIVNHTFYVAVYGKP